VAVITEAAIRELAGFRGQDAPVTTCYLDVDGRRLSRHRDYEQELERILRSARARANGTESVRSDLGRIEAYVKGGIDRSTTRGLLFVNTLDMGQVTSLIDADGPLPVARGPVSGRFSEPASRLMCQQPPWGRLTAVNVHSGAIVWQSVLGVSDNLPEAIQRTGRPNVGGSIATAAGLVFIGATDDSRFRAFDAASGRELWTAKLDASAHATPITYLGKSGRQFVVVTATGGSFLGSPVSSDAIVAFALPGTQPQLQIQHSATLPPLAARKAEDLPAGPGRDALVRSCVSCHELGVVLARGRTRAEWAEVTGLMVDRGAVIGEGEREILLDYLAAIAPGH